MEGLDGVMEMDYKKFTKKKVFLKLGIILSVMTVIYLLISIYFTNHFYYNTVINGVDVSYKTYDEVIPIIEEYIDQYQLEIVDRDGYTEKITGNDIGLFLNKKSSIYQIQYMQKPYFWIISYIKDCRYFVGDLFLYDEEALSSRVDALICLNKEIIEPKSVSFEYSNGFYQAIKEVYGNKINRDLLNQVIIRSILNGERTLDIDANNCYENPKYSLHSDKTKETEDKLNKFVKSKVIYRFGSKNEMIDYKLIREWLRVNRNLDIIIDEQEIHNYLKELAKKYNTIGIKRNFKTSTGKIVEVSGGLYGWKIDIFKEKEILLEEIQSGKVIEREPTYAQRALSREDNDIGNTYVEINITKQHLWFYKDGELVTEGPIVTGNASRGFDTDLGTYMLNYKITDATLRGQGYESKVRYWMPFYGNIGIHDARWRHSFGGKIYKQNGSHGCVNAPTYLARALYEEIEPGMPIICYEEEK